MRAKRVAVALSDSRILSSRCSARFLCIRPTTSAISSTPTPLIAAPIQVGGRRYFNLSKPRYAAVSGAASAA